MASTILVADDDRDLPGSIGRVLGRAGWKVASPCTRLGDLSHRLTKSAADVVLL